MAKLPLWLNTDTGIVIGAKNRPNGFVKVLLVEVYGETIHSTLDALYKLISSFNSPQHKIPLTDLEIKDTSIKSYGSPDKNKWWEQTLVDFPYINLSMDEHTILTITYQQIQADANGTQATTGREENEEDETLPGGRGGGRGGGSQGGQGEPNGEGEGEGGEPSEESGEGEGESKREQPIEGEDGDPYQQGKDKGSQLAEDKKSKMQELMDKATGGAPAEAGEGGEGDSGQGQGNGEGEGDSGEPGEGGSGEQSDGDSGQGEGGEFGNKVKAKVKMQMAERDRVMEMEKMMVPIVVRGMKIPMKA